MMLSPAGMTPLDGGIEEGVVWATVEAPIYGAVNGYVKLPEGHPWAGLCTLVLDVDVNGGITYDMDGWIGFNTLHSGDYWPGCPVFVAESASIHWTAELVADETRELAQQVARAMS